MNVIADSIKPRPLSCYASGMSVRVTSLEGGRCCSSRLLSLGIIPGTIINVINSCGRMTIQIRSSQFAIGCEMAKKIMAIPVCNRCECSKS
ncbi:FeoA family protein [Maridesulfovibrio hydrothermalis]|uniref:FeoA family protein n=1 Tax=Maridesulfovibrio hydrothermalis AM13 = DSM 14728 TaxID=1121451 RepID=L0RDB0_9BACT|nr:FeoA domain-containing protein [Maridesulfovibrio hydrothermalis]CCO24739.1 FeoA family protein [Maridesulfovibrio hydrothermalis AM13 = DSM 14728]